MTEATEHACTMSYHTHTPTHTHEHAVNFLLEEVHYISGAHRISQENPDLTASLLLICFNKVTVSTKQTGERKYPPKQTLINHEDTYTQSLFYKQKIVFFPTNQRTHDG